MRSQDTFMQALFKVGRVILVCIFNAVAHGQTANAQASMPEGTIGWYFYGPGSGNYAPDAVTACQLTATNHMGTQLKEMHPHPVIVWYDCKYPHFIAAGGEGWYGATFLECAAGYVPRWPGICTKVVEKPLPPKCMASDAGHARNNPVIISTGAKVQVEADPIGLALSPLSIERTYRTFGEPGGSLGVGWSFSFDRTLEPTSHSPGQAPAQVSGMWDHGRWCPTKWCMKTAPKPAFRKVA